MTEFTPEQEAEIQKRIMQAKQETNARAQWAIAGDQFFREALTAVAMKIHQQVYDPYVLDVGKSMYSAFREAHFTAAPQQEQNDEVPNKD